MAGCRLFAPSHYWRLQPWEKREICNGCGTKGLGGILVPDTLYGVSIEEACNIHDYMYHVGRTIEDKKLADRVFLNNMLRLIECRKYPWWLRWLRWLRCQRAMKYYQAVRDFGGPAFWKCKNPETQEREVAV